MLGWDSREGGREVQLGKEVKYKGEEEAEEVVEVVEVVEVEEEEEEEMMVRGGSAQTGGSTSLGAARILRPATAASPKRNSSPGDVKIDKCLYLSNYCIFILQPGEGADSGVCSQRS